MTTTSLYLPEIVGSSGKEEIRPQWLLNSLPGFGTLHTTASTTSTTSSGFLRLFLLPAFCVFESILGVWVLIIMYDTRMAV